MFAITERIVDISGPSHKEILVLLFSSERGALCIRLLVISRILYPIKTCAEKSVVHTGLLFNDKMF